MATERRAPLWERLQGTDVAAPDGWRRPGPGSRELRVDVLVALVAVALMVFSNWAVIELREAVPPEAVVHRNADLGRVGDVLVPVLYAAALALRRRFPAPMLVVATLGFLSAFTFGYLDTLVTQIGYFVVIFSAGAWSSSRAIVTLLRIGITIGMIVWAVTDALNKATALFSYSTGPESEAWISGIFGAYTLLINVLYFIGAFWFGNSDYRRAAQRAALEERTRELEERTEALARERRTVSDQAIRLDRVRIARELHDVVAHHVSLMGLQAAAARRTATSAPEKSEQALLGVESSARIAIDELHSLLTTLRGVDAEAAADQEEASLEAAPSTHTLEQVPALLDELRAAGMHIEFHTLGHPRPVSPLTGIAVYRVVQESLTNTRKHAGLDSLADVRIRYLDEGLEVDITDDGPRSRLPPGSAADSGGLGLVGMRERARAAGGTVETSKRAKTGFRVVLRVPYERRG